MSPDSLYSLLVLGLFLGVITFKQFSFGLLELLLKLTRPGATVLLLTLVTVLFVKKYFYTALVSALVSMFLIKDLWKSYVRSDARRLHLEIGRDQARFDPLNSIDLQFGNGTVTHDAPSMLSTSHDPKMLVYPPSAETQREMNG
jgi:hypothetical protein